MSRISAPDSASSPEERGVPGPAVPPGRSWQEICSRALLFVLADYPAMAAEELRGLNSQQLSDLAKAADVVMQLVFREFRERPHNPQSGKCREDSPEAPRPGPREH